MKKPNILIVGKSGSGKSTSLRNLNPETTAILNTEMKQLPFRDALKFKNKNITTVKEYFTAFQGCLNAKEIDTIVVDSFTSLIEMLYTEADASFRGFDVWSHYNKVIRQILLMSKNTDKNVIFIAIDGYQQNDDSVAERFCFVKGKEWLKKVEKEFVICLFTDPKANEDGVEYRFMTNTDGINSAKSPYEMFDEQYVENDLNMVLETAASYYQLEIE